MKNLAIILLFSISQFHGCGAAEPDVQSAQDEVIFNGIRWTGQDSVASYMAMIRRNRYLAYENSHAFIMSEAAVKKDSTFIRIPCIACHFG